MKRETALLTQMEHLERASREETDERLNEIFADGIVSCEEADRLFEMNPRICERTPGWDARFVEAICDYLLKTQAPQGWISDDEADWLIGHIERRDGPALDNEIELLLTLLRLAEGAPPRLGRFVLGCCCDAIIAQGIANDEDVEQVRRAIYAPSGDGGLWVTREEAARLFETNDAIAHARNARSWNEMFARAIGNHLIASAHPDPISEGEALRRETWLKSSDGGVFGAFSDSFGAGWFDRVTQNQAKAHAARRAAREAAERAGANVTEEESGWFLKRLGWDNSVSPAERELIEFLKVEAPGLTQGLGMIA